MATRKATTSSTEKKPTMSAMRKQNEKLKEELKKVTEGAYCYKCGRFLPLTEFYVDTDPKVKNSKKGNGLNAARVCKHCSEIVAQRFDSSGNPHEPTKDSVKEALKYLNKPFLESVWNAAIQESNNILSGSQRSNVWKSYMHLIQMKQYVGLTWEDSDDFKKPFQKYDDEKTEQELVEEHAGQDTYSDYLKNKADVTRLLGYDPFEEEKISDQPFLYAQLLGMLDSSEDQNDDMMRVASSVSIVRGFLQESKIDDAITKLMGDTSAVADNSATIKSLQDSKQKVTSMITNLAAESCLSLKNSKAKTKGENSFTGKLKKLKDLNLREAELNGFSEDTCKGMQQVANISMAAIINKLNMDESEWADIVKQQREMVAESRSKAEAYEEAFRLLLRENLDLRDELQKDGKLNSENLVDLDEVIGTYIEDNKD